MKKYIKKILVIGNHGVGKTSLVTRYVENKFSDAYLTTIGVNIMKKVVTLENEGEVVEVALMLWDVEGSTDNQMIPAHYAKGCNGYIVVVDGTREETLNNLKIHLDYINNMNETAPFVIAVNKSDLEAKISLDTAALKEIYPNCVNILKTSAKQDDNVEELFKIITNSTI